MTGETHRAGGFLCSVIGFAVLKHNGLLLTDVHEGLQWLMLYPFCMWGSVAPDLDHNSHAIPMKDPPSKLLNGILHIGAPLEKIAGDNKKSGVYKLGHLLNAHHRSWQTHSDLTLFLVGFLLYKIVSSEWQVGVVNALLLQIALTGICIGLIAHFILDMLTTDGVWSIVLCSIGLGVKKIFPKIKHFPQKLHIVPRLHCFRTGDDWEHFVCKTLHVCNWLGLIWLIYTVFDLQRLIPWEITFG